jgi:hypothetical protein
MPHVDAGLIGMLRGVSMTSPLDASTLYLLSAIMPQELRQERPQSVKGALHTQ